MTAKKVLDRIGGDANAQVVDRMMEKFGELQLQLARENHEAQRKLAQEQRESQNELFARLSADNKVAYEIHLGLVREISEQVDSRIGQLSTQLATQLAKPESTSRDRLMDMLVEIGGAILQNITSEPSS